MRRIALVLLLLLAACADERPKVESRWSGNPAADLESALASEDAYQQLNEWPKHRAGYEKASATQVAITERLLMHVERAALDAAYEDSEYLRVHFDGGRKRDGRAISIASLRAGLTDAAIDKARDLIAGDRPDRAKAVRTLVLATRVRGDEDEERVHKALQWVSIERLEALPTSTPWSLSKHEGPRVVIITDHFTLGEARIRAVLERWARHPSLRVSLIPTWRDNVRVGLRRVPATRKEERRALKASAKKLGLHYERGAAKVTWSRVLDLGRTATAVLVLHADGRIVGRLLGTFPNLQRLEGTVQRITTR